MKLDAGMRSYKEEDMRYLLIIEYSDGVYRAYEYGTWEAVLYMKNIINVPGITKKQTLLWKYENDVVWYPVKNKEVQA